MALLAFNRIVLTHPDLVAQQEDVIMDCIDSPDISIRLRALDLVMGMISTDNLMSIVGRLMRQLRSSNVAPSSIDDEFGQVRTSDIVPIADSDEERQAAIPRSPQERTEPGPQLPDDYRVDVISRILDMCASSNYSNLMDFDWYLDILVQLFRNAPYQNSASSIQSRSCHSNEIRCIDVTEKIGKELRSVAVKVKAIRVTATRAAESILTACSNGTMPVGKAAIRSIAWIVGEYATHLLSLEGALHALLHIAKPTMNPGILVICLQAIPKVFATLVGDEQEIWTTDRKMRTSLLMARIIHCMEHLSMHPDLEVQERAVEFIELFKLSAEASVLQQSSSDAVLQDAPLLLTQAIPSLFAGLELNSVAAGAQRNVPLSPALDLDQPVNPQLPELLHAADDYYSEDPDQDDFEVYYFAAPLESAKNLAAADRLVINEDDVRSSYQYEGENSYLDPDIVARRRAERLERNKDDPFYIAGNDAEASTSLHNIIQNDNGTDMDIDSIPIMQLDLGKTPTVVPALIRQHGKGSSSSRTRQRVKVAADETLVASDTSTPRNEESEATLEGLSRSRPLRSKQALLLVDSSSIGSYSIENDQRGVSGPKSDTNTRRGEEVEMTKAMQEVESLRLEMQRAKERIQAAQDVPPEGTIVKKKTKKKAKKPKSKSIKEGGDLSKPTKRRSGNKSPNPEHVNVGSGALLE